MKTCLARVLSVLATLFMFASSANAITLTADPGTVGLPPSNITIPLPPGSTSNDLNVFYIDFDGNEFIQLTGPSSIEINLNTTWNIPTVGQLSPHLFPGWFVFYDINENPYGFSLSGFFDFQPDFQFSFTMTSISNPLPAFPPIYSIRWTPFFDIPTFVDFLAPNTLANGTLTLNMSRVIGTVGETATPAPVPEPSTFILLGAGLAGLAVVGIRRRKNV